MKFPINRAIVFAVVSSAVLLAATSCKKSSSSGSSNGISATVSGSAWAPSYPTAAYYSGGVFTVVGLQFKNGDSTAVQVTFVSPFIVNQPIASDTSGIDLNYIVSSSSQSDVFDGSYGSGGHTLLTITSFDSTGHKIAGKFSGVLYDGSNGADSVVITNGAFNTSYTVQ